MRLRWLRFLLRVAAPWAAALLLAAPARPATTLEGVRDHAGDGPPPRPGVILVYDFDAHPERVQVDLPTFEMLTGGSVSGPQRAEAARRASSGLAHALFEALSRRGAPVQRAHAETTVPERALLVKGRFLSVDEGGGAAAGIAGLGPGTVRVRMQFDAYQQHPWAAKLLWQGRVATESSPLETALIAQGAVAEATGGAVGGGAAAQSAAQRGRELVARYTAQTAETIAEALWQRFRSAGWIVDGNR